MTEMDTKRLENIILLILLLLNAFLLSMVLSERADARQETDETVEMLTRLLRANDIVVGAEADLVQSAPAACTVVRDMELERQRMEGLLGSINTEDQGGSIWYYYSNRGQLVMRGTGEMDLLYDGDAVKKRGDPLKAATRLFSRAGLELYADGARLSGEELSICCCWNGYPVYNARLSFDFSGEQLQLVTGTVVFNTESETGEVGMDSVTVVTRFVELVTSEGFICSRLESLTPGYLMTVTRSGESTLNPVWRIATDTGELYINALSGQVETVV